MPGTGVKPAARILHKISDASNPAPSGHRAAYAGIAPVNRASGTSVKGEHPGPDPQPHTYPRALPRRARPTPTRSAAPTTTANEPRARTQPALIRLARRRDVPYAILRTNTHHRHPEPAPVPTAA
ncbi:transposase [Actinokineospora sp. NBRC 105648]|uniref:transposase n=1 Tax=Actinokineospora sp. NBRC 105648 TaxID=3032206 RepID=UPI0024A25A5B|nr:transposase [Actinokineospora sp. NBRC 105648]GLZ41283.1 hypothetical protein Acsp05_49070 [Actinokineospora sp. NBRC 105648]